MRNNKKAEAHDEWQARKDTILDLYITKDMPLKEVMKCMAAQGFNRTKPQYERILKSKGWAVSKNIRSAEWRFIFIRLQDRAGKRSTVKVRGITIPKARLSKEKRRQGYLKAYEQHALQFNTIVRPATPPGIEIHTPPQSPLPEVEIVQQLPNHGTHDSGDAPWWQHSNLLDPSSAPPTIGGSLHAEGFEAKQDWMAEILDDLNAQLKLEPEKKSSDNADEPLVIISSPSAHDFPQILLVKVFKNVVSKHLDFQSATAAVLRLMHDEQCSPVLQRLLHLPNVPVIKSFAQRLLVPAARDGNLALVKTLVESGLDPNKRFSDKRAAPQQRRSTTALEYAVYNRRRDLTEYLLRHGATDWHAELDEVDGILPGTILDVIIERDKAKQWMGHQSKREQAQSIDRDIFRMILESKPRGSYTAKERSLRTLRLAVLRGRLDYVDLLKLFMPDLWQDARRYSWILLEAASSIEGVDMFHALVKRGLDVHATDENGYGSALAAAVSSSNYGLLRHLMTLEVDPDRLAFGLGDRKSQGAITGSEERLQHLHGLAAIHIATQKNDGVIVDMLLNYGADANLGCGAYPIQIAASNGNVSMLEKLLRAGADVNAISPNAATNTLVSTIDGPGSTKLCANRTALQIAFESGSLPVIALLRSKGGRLHSSAELGGSTTWDPLHIAIQNRDSDLVRYVLEEVYCHASKPGQLVHMTDSPDNRDVAKELMDIGPLRTRAACQLAVMCAGIALRKTSLVEYTLYQMISTSVEVVPRWYAGRALILAVRERQAKLIWMFLTAGLSAFDRITPGGEELFDLDEHYMFWENVSAFECAVKYERLDILTTLLTHKSRRSDERQQLVVQRQLGAAYASAICTDNSKLQAMILQAGLRLSQIDNIMGERQYIGRRLYSTLQEAAQTGDLEEVEWLLQKGARPDLPDLPSADTGDGWTPLQHAAGRGHSSIVKILLRAGAAVNAAPTTRYGRSALQAASENGHYEVVRLLLEAKADINGLPSAYEGRTAIEGAANRGHLRIVVLLLSSGADVGGRSNENYRNTVYRAWKSGHHNLIRVLEAWKLEHFGAEDCEALATILASMALREQDLARRTEDEVVEMEDSDYDTEGDGYESPSIGPAKQLLLTEG